MMQDQLDRSREEVKGIEMMKLKVEGILEGLGNAKLAEKDIGGGNDDTDAEDEEVQELRDVWDEVWKVSG
jgi:mediator of RNA polymerase II transcription subunit 7